MVRELRVGVIGAGVVAREIHVPGYAGCPRADVAAVASASVESANRLARVAGAARVFSTPGELLADSDIEAVSICTPPHSHRELVEAATAAGKHVLVEKPIATTLHDLDAIVALARRTELVVDVVRNERFMAFNRRVRAAVVDGFVGEPLGILQSISTTGPESWAPAAGWFRDAARSGGGALIDLGVHKVDQACWIAGRPLSDARPAVFRERGEIEQEALLAFQLEGPVSCAVHTSWKGPPDEASVVVTGTGGVLTGVWSSGTITCRGHRDATWTEPVPWSEDDRSGGAMVADFVDRCLTGRRSIGDDPAWDSGTRAVLLGYAGEGAST